jgi:hypothetical protein
LGVNCHARSGKFGNRWSDEMHKCRFCKGLFQEREGVASMLSEVTDRLETAAKGSVFGKLSLCGVVHMLPRRASG